MKPRRVLAITRRIFSQFRHDRRTLALLFVVPLVILSLLYYLLRGGGGQPAVGVVNLDAGPLGAVVARQLESSSQVKASQLDLTTAQSRLRDDRLAGYIVLPTNFSSDMLQQGVLRPEVHLEGSQPAQSGAVLQALSQSLLAALGTLPSQPGLRPPRLDLRVTYLYGGPQLDTLDYFGGAFIGLVVFFLVFVITCVAFLRERSQGTLERVTAGPLRRGEGGGRYMTAFSPRALLQSGEVLVFGLAVLKVYNPGSVALIFGIEAILAVGAVNLGIFLSMFARTEFQAVQFIPLVVVPQLLLSGILFPVSSEPKQLQLLSNVLPLTYAVNGLRDVMVKGADLSWSSLQLDVGVVLGFVVLVLLAAIATLRRRIA